MYHELAEKFIESTPDRLYALIATFYWILHPHREGLFFVCKNDSWLLMRSDGSKILLPKSRPISQPEPYERYFRVEPDEIVLDVGACIGEVAIPAAKKAKKVIAVEANPENLCWLRNNIALNNLKNIHIVEKAAWNNKKTLKLYLDKENVGGHSLINKRNRESIEVQTDTLDNIVSELEISKIDFIKIDIEGAELEALSGAKNILKKCRKIVVESHVREGRETTASVCRVLRKYFDTCFVLPRGKLKLIYAKEGSIEA